jgi:hypothetical protein
MTEISFLTRELLFHTLMPPRWTPSYQLLWIQMLDADHRYMP